MRKIENGKDHAKPEADGASTRLMVVYAVALGL